jgi:hypothetical protein
MAITDEIYKRVKQAVTLAVGTRLHQLPLQGGGTTGDVQDARKRRIAAVRPYAEVVIQNRTPQSSWAVNIYYDADGNQVTETIYDYYISIGIFGGDALGICGDCEQAFVRRGIRQIFSIDNFAAIAATRQSVATYTSAQNETQQFASFILKLTAIERVLEVEDEIIDISGTIESQNPDDGITLTTIDALSSRP